MSALETLVNFVNIYSPAQGVEIRFSDVTKQYYCSVPFDIKDRIFLKSISCHANTIEESARETLNTIKGKVLVFNLYGTNRKEVYYHKEPE